MSGTRQYDVVQSVAPNRNGFDLSHSTTTSFNMGNLVPVMVQEVIPGDNFTIGAEALCRFAPLVNPVMHRFDARVEYFFVPNRLVWNNWTKWISAQPGNPDTPAFPIVQINAANYNKLCNYMGIPRPDLSNFEQVNAIPFAAYQLIYNQYYRDQNLQTQDPAGYTLFDGDNTANIGFITEFHNRAWEHDLFTSCLPFAQKGNPVTIGTVAYKDMPVLINSGSTTEVDRSWPGTDHPGGTTNDTFAYHGDTSEPGIGGQHLFVDTSEFDNLSVTINQLRDAAALQQWLEINARAGTRINEVIEGHFNVKPDDARLQRPEYITGVKTPIAISEVLSTADTADLPQGNMAGHGIGAITDPNFGSYFAKEHGFIIGIMSIMPKTAYQQGLDKHWIKWKDITQYYWPTFAHLGEQPLENREVYAYQGASGGNTFGYMPAYYDYRGKNNRITGDFQTTLSSWTAARIFDTPPALNAAFIRSNPRTDIFAVTDEGIDHMYVTVLNKVFASRLIPEYGTPGLEKL